MGSDPSDRGGDIAGGYLCGYWFGGEGGFGSLERDDDLDEEVDCFSSRKVSHSFR